MLPLNANECPRVGITTYPVTEGYISLSQASISLQSECFWHIAVEPGMTVNITMYSFLPTPDPDKPLTVTSSACYEVGSVREDKSSKTIHKCLNDPRHKPIYLSGGGNVDILTNKDVADLAGYYILHFQGLFFIYFT